MRRIGMTVIAVVLTALAGCAGERKGGDGTAAPAAPAAVASSSPAVASSAPASAAAPPAVPAQLRFTGKTVDGRDFDAAALAGKPVVLWFWAPWCPTCMQQAEVVNGVAAKYSGKVSIVGVAGLDKPAEMKKFIAEYKVGALPHLSDEPGAIWKRFGVTAQSTYVLIDKAGNVAVKGYLDADGLDKRVAALVG